MMYYGANAASQAFVLLLCSKLEDNEVVYMYMSHRSNTMVFYLCIHVG